jgi:hypothetical protein
MQNIRLLTCRLKIIPTSNLKLIISFLALPLLLLSPQKSLSLVASTRHAPLTSHVYLRLANRPSAQLANSTIKNDLQATGTGSAFLSRQGSVLVAQVFIVAYLAHKTLSFFLLQFAQRKKSKKILSMSYIWGQNFSGIHLTLSCPMPMWRLCGVLTLAIYIFPNNGLIDLFLGEEMVLFHYLEVSQLDHYWWSCSTSK